MTEPVRRLVRYRVTIRPRRLTPFRRVNGRWVTNASPIYVERLTDAQRAKRRPRISLVPVHGYAALITADELEVVQAIARRRLWIVDADRDDLVIPRYTWLDGDLDANADLLERLNRVGKRLGRVIFVRSGKRTIAEQTALWNRYGPPRAARPNPNAPHVRGIAADCGIDGRDIGDVPGARAAMRAEGLCLRVPGEDWHVEVGTTWAA